jgi:hypothetical protein
MGNTWEREIAYWEEIGEIGAGHDTFIVMNLFLGNSFQRATKRAKHDRDEIQNVLYIMTGAVRYVKYKEGNEINQYS